MKKTILTPFIYLTAGICLLFNLNASAQSDVSINKLKLIRHINGETVVEEKEVASFDEANFKSIADQYNNNYNMTISYSRIPNSDQLVRNIVIDENAEQTPDPYKVDITLVADETGTKTKSIQVNSENDVAVTQAVVLSQDGNAPIKRKTVIIKDDAVMDNRLSLPDLSIYPNPTTDNVNLNFSILDMGNTYVTVTDLNGTEIFHEDLPNFTGNYQNLVTLPNMDGIYSLNVVHNGKAINKKIIKKQ